MNTRADIPAATTIAATDVSDAITAYSVAVTVGFAKAAQSSTTKYAAETSSIRELFWRHHQGLFITLTKPLDHAKHPGNLDPVVEAFPIAVMKLVKKTNSP
ncbi:hypothetical protein GOBAR_AA04720 [Gossypium barbadense]|uniref:Uncharacterized protein n=1 Tax=Gossypium barbadense TaxID=3634 RepID=A0A2P5YJW3_GOSBA|nr:hypothetical protein GOBAR_AA04720 [Gossypium barbadense]